MISIIIPHYNTPELLARLLDSINYDIDTEVIVIDDKSNINIKKYSNIKEDSKYSNIIFLENNSSVKSAGMCRNIGLKNAKGQWILFADSDDKFVEGYTKKIKKYLEAKEDVVFFAPTSINLETQEKSHRHYVTKQIINKYLENNDELSVLLLKYKLPEPWAKLIRREFLVKYNINFDETIAANDRMFSTKVGYYMKNYIASKEIIYCVSFVKGSLTNNYTKEVFNTRMDVYIEYYHFLKERVTKEQFKLLNISGTKFIFKCFSHGFGLFYAFRVCNKLLKNKVRFLSWNMLNPYKIIKYIVKSALLYFKYKKYYIKS